MNALVLKWLTSSIVGLVVCSAIWLAGSLKLSPGASPFRLASVGASVPPLHALERSPKPADYAASAAMQRVVELR